MVCDICETWQSQFNAKEKVVWLIIILGNVDYLKWCLIHANLRINTRKRVLFHEQRLESNVKQSKIHTVHCVKKMKEMNFTIKNL